MELIILGSILLLRVAQSVTGKACSKYTPTDSFGMIWYMSVRMGLSAVAALVLLCIGGTVLEDISSLPILGWTISLATGISLTISSICSLLAMKGASVALTSLFGAAGLLIPTISGIFIYGQNVTFGQWTGIFCLFIAAVLLASSSGKTNGKIKAQTVIFLFGSMVANGCTMLFQTLFKSYVPEGNVSVFSFLQFFVPAAILFIISFTYSKGVHVEIPKLERKLLGHTLGASVAVFGVSQLSTIASQFIPIAVLFPISDGGHTIIAALVAAVVYKEKLTLRSVSGVLIGVIGLIMIKLLSGC